MNNGLNTHIEQEKTINREVIVAGATTSRVGYDGIMQSTPRYVEDSKLAETMRWADEKFYKHLGGSNLSPQIELWTSVLGYTYFFLGQKEFTNFPKATRYYEQLIVSMFKTEELFRTEEQYRHDLADILLANQPGFQQYEKPELGKIPTTLTYKPLNIQHDQKLLELLEAKTPIIYHIAMDDINIHGNAWASFPPLQSLFATIARLSIERQKDIVLSTHEPMSISRTRESVKTIIPAKSGYWKDKNGKKITPPEEGRWEKRKWDKMEKKWINPVPERSKIEEKVKETTKNYDNIIIHYGPASERTDENNRQIDLYKRFGQTTIYPAN